MKKEYRALWIINSTGICLFHHSIEKLGVDQNLVGGFISAILSFTESIFTDKLSSFDMSLGRLSYLYSGRVIYCLLTQKSAKSDKVMDFLREAERVFTEKYLQGVDFTSLTDVTPFEGFQTDLLEILGIAPREREEQDLSQLAQLVYMLIEISKGQREYTEKEKALILQFMDSSDYTQTVRTMKAIESIADFLVNDQDINKRIKNITKSMLRERTKFL
jgi:hypothetical protein